MMTEYYWNGWYTGWGWFLWPGMVLAIFASFSNWGYTYKVQRRIRDGHSGKDATDFLNERYAKGEIDREEFNQIKSEIHKNNFVAKESPKRKSHSKPERGSSDKDGRYTYQNDKNYQRDQAQKHNERFKS